jgi:hypothetical protein
VLPVPVALVPLPTRDHNERTEVADDSHHVPQHVGAIPVLQRFVEPLGEAVVGDGREVLLVEAVVAPRQLELGGPNQAKAIEQLGAKRIVASFAAVQREQCGPGAIVPPDPRQHRALFIVRVRRRMEKTGGRAQLQQALPRAARGAVERIPSIRHCLAADEQREGESKSGTGDCTDAPRGCSHGPDCTGSTLHKCTMHNRIGPSRQLCAL